MNTREEAQLNRQHGSRGQILPVVGLLIVTIAGFGAAAIDIGSLDYQWQRQQSASDAAAVAGAKALIANGCPNQAAAQAAAATDAATNGFSTGGSVTVTVNNPPQTGPYSVLGGEPTAGANCAVQVQINNSNPGSWLAAFLGYPMPENTQAVAQMQSSNNTCI
jgi:Flp pilus assembly protein TadG